MKTLSELATECLSYLTKNGDVVVQTDDAPQWFTDVCHKAHNGMLPDDWKYEFIEDALDALANDDECSDVDSLYPYTADRLRWLASSLDRPTYCDDAMGEYGCDFKDTNTLIALGMQYEMREVYDTVRNELEKHNETYE